MRAILVLIIFFGVPYLGYKAAIRHYEAAAARDIALLEERTKQLGEALSTALSKNSKLTGEEALDALSAFVTQSGNVGGLPMDEFWDNTYSKGSFEAVWPKTYSLKQKLYQAGPTFWPDKEHHTTKFSAKLWENLRLGYVDATVTITGRGIPSKETLDELIETMRRQNALTNYIFYHGMPANIYMTMHWVYRGNNWYLDPDTPAAFKHHYRPQQKLAATP